MSMFSDGIKYAFGGYIKDKNVLFNSTSGGAFTALVDTYCDENYVIFGADADGLKVFHSYITDKNKLEKFRKSKYAQSKMGDSYKDAKSFLQQGKKVLFSGTPCQVAGLKTFLQNTDTTKLLTIEVICEGVPSPLYIRKYEKSFGTIKLIDYRYKGKSIFGSGKWDFQAMEIRGIGKRKIIDRWFNPFWSIWLQHLMSRPSCYKCNFAKNERTADITLGDLWGVHLYCPELYGKNGGASVVFANTEKGREVVLKAQEMMYGHELNVDDALKYQSPMKKHIDSNLNREAFIADLKSDMTYEEVNKKWAEKPTIKLLWQKYVWGNRQKVRLWSLTKGKCRIK